MLRAALCLDIEKAWSTEFISVECHCEELTSEIINQQPAQRLQKRLETTRAIYFSMEFTEDKIRASLSRNAEAIQRNTLKACGSPEHDSLLQPVLNINTPSSSDAGYLHGRITCRPSPKSAKFWASISLYRSKKDRIPPARWCFPGEIKYWSTQPCDLCNNVSIPSAVKGVSYAHLPVGVNVWRGRKKSEPDRKFMILTGSRKRGRAVRSL